MDFFPLTIFLNNHFFFPAALLKLHRELWIKMFYLGVPGGKTHGSIQVLPTLSPPVTRSLRFSLWLIHSSSKHFINYSLGFPTLALVSTRFLFLWLVILCIHLCLSNLKATVSLGTSLLWWIQELLTLQFVQLFTCFYDEVTSSTFQAPYMPDWKPDV